MLPRALIVALLVLSAAPVSAASVTIAWDPNPTSDNVTGYLAGYVEVPSTTKICSTDGSADTFVPVSPSTATTFTITTLMAGRTYCLRLYAMNANGRSNASNTVGPFTAAGTPPDPVLPGAFTITSMREVEDLPLWRESMLGAPALLGSSDHEGDRFTLSAGGSDIWNTTDEGHFVYQPIVGDVTILARVDTLAPAPDPWSKAGLMIRETLRATAPNVFAAASRDNGWTAQWRLTESAQSASINPKVPGSAPGWLRLQRRGNVFTVARSADGITWTVYSTTTVAMTNDVLVGLAVTSHQPTTRAQAVFSRVTVSVP